MNRACEGSHDDCFTQQTRIGSRRARTRGGDRRGIREKTRNRGEVGRAGTHLLPWGCQTIMELVLAALPVETAGALLRTGATAERAAILTVEGVVCCVRAVMSHNAADRCLLR